MNEAIGLNADKNERAVVRTAEEQWQPSPSSTVWRKRVYLNGQKESGAVTSVVRYDPGASFHQHPHPQGEEILVLSGVFSDEQGHWPAGSYLLNPEGFCHAPFSEQGCVLFVKLRQYAGLDRQHISLQTQSLAWTSGAHEGVSHKILYEEKGFPERMALELWQPGVGFDVRTYEAGVEIFVVEGDLADEQGQYPAGSWLRLPPGACHQPFSEQGCEIYIRT